MLRGFCFAAAGKDARRTARRPDSPSRRSSPRRARNGPGSSARPRGTPCPRCRWRSGRRGTRTGHSRPRRSTRRACRRLGSSARRVRSRHRSRRRGSPRTAGQPAGADRLPRGTGAPRAQRRSRHPNSTARRGTARRSTSSRRRTRRPRCRRAGGGCRRSSGPAPGSVPPRRSRTCAARTASPRCTESNCDGYRPGPCSRQRCSSRRRRRRRRSTWRRGRSRSRSRNQRSYCRCRTSGRAGIRRHCNNCPACTAPCSRPPRLRIDPKRCTAGRGPAHRRAARAGRGRSPHSRSTRPRRTRHRSSARPRGTGRRSCRRRN